MEKITNFVQNKTLFDITSPNIYILKTYKIKIKKLIHFLPKNTFCVKTNKKIIKHYFV